MNSKNTPWFMLFSRILLFAGVQSLFALVFWLAGSARAWEAGANWWPIGIGIADLVCLGLLIGIFRGEGRRYWDIFRFERAQVKGDLLAMLGILLLAAPLSFLPNIWLGQALFGSPEASLALIVRPLPLWVVYVALFFFPIGQGLTELALYFIYVMPRFETQGMNKWLAMAIPTLMLGFQHIAAPLLFDARFITWRAFMFLPFAILCGIVLRWRPRLLPYMAIVHVLMNMSFAAMFLSAAY